MPVGDLAGEIALVVTAAVIVLVTAFVGERTQWVGAVIAAIGSGVSAALIIARTGGGEQFVTFSGSWAADRSAAMAELLILAVTVLVVMTSPGWMRTDARHGEWYAILCFAAAGAMVMAAAADLAELMVGVLLSSITGYVLASYHRRSALSVEAGAKYFLLGALANAVLLIGITLLFGLTGATTYGAVAGALGDGSSAVVLTAAVIALVVGLAFKIGAVPAHMWMPDVAQGSPAPAAAFLTVVPKIGAVIALARLLPLLPDTAVAWRPAVAAVSAVTMTVGNLAALWQDDLRRLLGWSSVSQGGYALMAVVVMDRSPDAIAAMIVFLAAYAVAQVAAFAVLTELRGRTRIADYGHLFAQRPLLAAVLSLALFSFVGIPPLAGFTGKLLLFEVTIDGGYAWLAALAVANTVVSLFYYLRVIAPMALGVGRSNWRENTPADEPGDGRVDEAAPVLDAPLGTTATVVSGVLVVGVGVAAEVLLVNLDGARLLPW